MLAIGIELFNKVKCNFNIRLCKITSKKSMQTCWLNLNSIFNQLTNEEICEYSESLLTLKLHLQYYK